MKLVDILARELKVWPEGMGAAYRSGHLLLFCTGPGTSRSHVLDIRIDPEDQEDALVTRAEWQAAVDALNAPKVVEWPEGATHKFSEPTTSPWRDLSGATWKWFDSGIWRDSGRTPESLMTNQPHRLTKLPIPQKEIAMADLVVEWDGWSLPSLGLECEFHTTDAGDFWCAATVKFVGTHFIIVGYQHPNLGISEAGVNHEMLNGNFSGLLRPIRTAEQIAAEERENGIQAIQDAYTYTVESCTHKILHSQAARLYDAGCRLQVVK